VGSTQKKCMKLEMSFFFSVEEICLFTLIVLTGDFGSIFGKSGRVGSVWVSFLRFGFEFGTLPLRM